MIPGTKNMTRRDSKRPVREATIGAGLARGLVEVAVSRGADRQELLERVPGDELHGVEGSAIAPAVELIYRDDRGMLQLRGDSRLALEAAHDPGVA